MEELNKIKYGEYTTTNKRVLALEIIQRAETDTEKLELFRYFYDNLPIQGSGEWLMARRIGGSSAAAILGKNKFSDPYKTACEILNISEFKGNVSTKFGNTFEEVAKKYLERYAKIYEFGSLYGFGEPMCTTYSPDGLFIMTPELAELCGAQQYIGRCILLEIKCLYNRKISVIPEYYLPQMYLGMETIQITPASMFSEFVIRPCSLYDFGFNSRHVNIGYASYKNRPLAIGLIFYKCDVQNNRIDLGYTNIINAYKEKYNTCLDPYIFEFGRLWRFLANYDLLDIEYARIYFDLYPDLHYEACEFLHVYYPKFAGVDYGTGKNFLYNSGSYEEAIMSTYDKVYTDLIYECSEREAREKMTEYINKYSDYTGVMAYKIMDFKLTMVEKKDYSLEVKKLVFFGKNIYNLEKKELKSFCDKFDRSYNVVNN